MPDVFNQRRGLAGPREKRARGARLASLDRACDSAACWGTNPTALSARSGLSPEIPVSAHDHVFDPRDSCRLSSAPTRRHAFPPAARQRAAPSVGDLRTGRDPMVCIFPFASPAPLSLERSLLSERPRHMKTILLNLLAAHCFAGIAVAVPMPKLGDFELTDQEVRKRSYHFPKTKVTVMTVADQKGAEQLAPWIQCVYDRYQNRIDIDGVADVSMIPKLFRAMLRKAFKKQLTYSVMLDWDGSVAKRFAYEKGVANIYVIDRGGRIVKQLTGPVNDVALRELFSDIDGAIADTSTQ